VNSRNHTGGTAPEQVKKAIATYRKNLKWLMLLRESR
jgi:argininosuccinate lyase